MKHAFKVLAPLVLLIAGILSLSALQRIRREASLFDSDTRQDYRRIGRALRQLAERVRHLQGDAEAIRLVERANAADRNLAIHWVWLDAAPGAPNAPLVAPAALARVRQGREHTVRLERGTGWLVTYVPFLGSTSRPAALEIRETLRQERAYLRATKVTVVVTTVLLVGVCAVLMTLIGVFLVARPVQQLVDKAHRVGEGDLSGPIYLPQRDELGDLAVEMNRMSDRLAESRARAEADQASRLAALEQLRHADRLSTVGKLASGIAHELGTPLNVVLGRAHLIARGDVEGAEAQDNARIIEEQVQRMAGIIRQLLDFARSRPARRAALDLRAIAARTEALLQPFAQKRQVTLRLEEGPPSVPYLGDEGQLQQVLINLLMNGIQATPPEGSVTLSLGSETATPPPDPGGPEGTFLYLRVTDTGCGMDAETQLHVFEPFFTTKEVGEGTGLGLSVTFGIVREHGGWITVSSEPGRGSTFSVLLPPTPQEGGAAT